MTGPSIATRRVTVDGRVYTARVLRRVCAPPDAPRLVVVSYQPTGPARDVLDVCIQAVQRYTPEPHELWVVDNNSPANRHWLLEQPGINVVLNQTEPLPLDRRGLRRWFLPKGSQSDWGSYANAVALEIVAQLIEDDCEILMPMHMDVMPCRTGWLRFLRSKLDDRVRAAGVRMDRSRTPEGVLHVLGYLVDFQLFRRLGLDFFPDLPQFDVGDRVTVALRQAGYDVFACSNTLWQPELVETIPAGSPLRRLGVDRSFDDDGNVIFLHLGRGVRKSSGGHREGISTQDWIRFAREHILREPQHKAEYRA